MQRLLLLATTVIVTAAFAGCADNAPGSDAIPSLPAAAPLSDDAARDLLEQAIAAMPERFGFQLVASKGGSEMMRASGTFDNATGENHVHVSGAPAAFQGMRALAEGLDLYTSPRGAVYAFSDVAIVQGAAIDELSGVVPATMIRPDMVFDQIGDDVTITSVKLASWNGGPAVDVGFTATHEATSVSGTLTLVQEDARIVRAVVTLPAEQRAGPFSGATLALDLLYDDEIRGVPDAMLRIVGVGHRAQADAAGNRTWTFLGDGPALGELQAQVKDGSEGGSLSAARTALVLGLDAGTGSAEGLTVTFDDADANGFVSAGDTLRMSVADDATLEPQLVLYDTVGERYVTSDFMLVVSALFGGF